MYLSPTGTLIRALVVVLVAPRALRTGAWARLE
jgi:hypothetical protein